MSKPSDFGHFLSKMLSAQGISQSELARRTGIQQGNVSLICSGKRIAEPATVRKIAEAVGGWGEQQALAAAYVQLCAVGELSHLVSVVPVRDDARVGFERIDDASGGALTLLTDKCRAAGAFDALIDVLRAIAAK